MTDANEDAPERTLLVILDEIETLLAELRAMYDAISSEDQ